MGRQSGTPEAGITMAFIPTPGLAGCRAHVSVGGGMLGTAHTVHTVWAPWWHGGDSGAHALDAWQMFLEC